MATNRTEEETFVELIKTFLKEFTEGKFSFNSNKDECEATLNMSTHLFAGLRTSQQERNDGLSLKSLKYLTISGRASTDDTKQLALQFSNLLLKSKAIKKKTEYKSCAKIRRATTANLKKPIEELIVVKTAPRSKKGGKISVVKNTNTPKPVAEGKENVLKKVGKRVKTGMSIDGAHPLIQGPSKKPKKEF
ncbi:hypothetical protein DAPPUDRAFT_333955 [Daphnia pulex]|uniref:Uncharacterized protein n=1 Tax=Daphnia pulex TaxID=6669 RepID=E9HUA5_DAPPU|nr:hypothetical protein DAPPUDRAFT_333955 [Daphnia pulex]|eukprot:EFX64665.1 hypothetical protein DAPPUDRAFT_333955 [Daphnia pulex]